jgi:4-hydroxy-tetrahydrodipicolinate synthase
MRSLCGDDLAIYSGEDALITPLLSIGGKGVISVLSNVTPRETHEICSLFFEGKVKESAALQLKLSSLIDALFCDVNPIPVKHALNMMGRNAGPCRMPLCEPGEAQAAQIEAALKKNGLI